MILDDILMPVTFGMKENTNHLLNKPSAEESTVWF